QITRVSSEFDRFPTSQTHLRMCENSVTLAGWKLFRREHRLSYQVNIQVPLIKLIGQLEPSLKFAQFLNLPTQDWMLPQSLLKFTRVFRSQLAGNVTWDKIQ